MENRACNVIRLCRLVGCATRCSIGIDWGRICTSFYSERTIDRKRAVAFGAASRLVGSLFGFRLT